MLQRKQGNGNDFDGVPSIVHEVLRSSSRPLDAATRAFMEPRFGHDFSRVHVHSDARAAESARAVNALAYTVGVDVVFGQGEYAPGTPAGRRLLAHELTHVVQQASGARTRTFQRSSIGSMPYMVIGPEEDELEREASRSAEIIDEEQEEVVRVQRAAVPSLQRHVAIVGLDQAGPEANLAGKTESELFNCIKGAKPDSEECVPNRTLTWADFAGTPLAKSNFAADTKAPVTDVPMEAQLAVCLQRILGKTPDETRVFQTQLDSSKSWVKPAFKDPANAGLTGCSKTISLCEDYFKKNTGTWTPKSATNPKCGAIIKPDPSVKANSKDECATAVGKECDRVAQLESARLLRHEQCHFDINCALAKKATSALMAGGKLADIKKSVVSPGSKIKDAKDKYDADSKHGCDAAGQANWEAEIGNGLPKISIP